MRHLMPLRYQIAVTFFLITSISAGCATYPKVDTALLEQSKSKTFKIGIVKIKGDSNTGFFGIPDTDGEYIKKKALEGVPISEICSILSSKYSITIDTNVDKTARTVKEAMNSGPPSASNRPGLSFSVTLQLFQTENPYYGNLQYKNESTLGIVAGSSSQIMNDNMFPDIVNVTYSVEHGMLKESYFYDINVRSSEQDIIELRGLVGTTGPGTLEANWTSYADFAGRIGEALKKDLLEAANKPSEQPSRKKEMEL